ncbi:hypothetical protein OAI99_02670 [Candidatus Pelagibacter sp.]|nr:hypothetical protein [Candidatus Pelagibacter sp.]
MKKFIIFISLFIFITLNNSMSAPIKVFGIDLRMELKTVEDMLVKKDFKCNYANMTALTCNKSPEMKITFSKEPDMLLVNCEAYKGCNASATEIAKFFSNHLKLNIATLSSYGIFRDPAYCGDGPDGDKICVVFSLNNNLGPKIVLLKHRLDEPGLSTTLD